MVYTLFQDLNFPSCAVYLSFPTSSLLFKQTSANLLNTHTSL